MNAEIKAKWVAALRSGEYEQGKYGLRGGGKYCCLGVLCDLHSIESDGVWDVVEGIYYPQGRDGGFGRTGHLPDRVASWAGLRLHSPEVQGVPLSMYNDGFLEIRSHSFIEIADLIEKHL